MKSPFRALIFGIAFSILATSIYPAHADDASRRSAAEELLKTMRADEQQARTVEQAKVMIAGMANRSMQQYGVSPEAAEAARKTQSEMMDVIFRKLNWESMKADFVSIYAETFTESELKDLTAFYRSPTGQKLLEKQPQLAARMMEISQKRTMELMPEIQAMISGRSAPAGSPTPATSPTPGGSGR